MKKRIRIQGALIFLSLVLILLSGAFLPRWKHKHVDGLLDFAGIGFVLIGFTIRVSARGYKEEGSAQGRRLVTGGPYAYSRNPMYFGTFLIGTGIVLLLLKIWAFLLFTAVFLAIYLPQTKEEEKVLFERFGEQYKKYLQVTPRFFPGVIGLFKIARCLYLKRSWISKELVSFAVTITIVSVIEIWEDVQSFGKSELVKEPIKLAAIITLFLTLLFIVRNRRLHDGKNNQ